MSDITKKSPKEKAIGAMQNICSVAGILYRGVREDITLTQDEIRTYINGIEFCVKDIAEFYNYDSILAKQMEERHKELREANARITALENELKSKDISSETVTAKLSLYEDAARALYEAAGFHYGSISFTTRSLVIEMSAEYERQPQPHITRMTELFNQLRKQIEAKYLSGFELVQESSYRDYIKDTPENRKRIEDLYRIFVPDFRITGFTSTQVNDEWTCRHNVHIPYVDIEKLITSYTAKEAQPC